MVATPSRRKRKLGLHLRDIRDKSGMGMSDAAELLRVSQSNVSRFETGYLRPGWAAMQALLDAYRAADPDRALAKKLWEQAEEPVTRLDLPGPTPKEYRLFLRAEAEANAERMIAPLIVPAMLQTADYAEALYQAGQRFHDPSVRMARYVASRLRRQQRLSEANPLRLHVLLDEMTLRREVGGAQVLREQLAHLLAMADRGSVTVQVIPGGVGAYGTMTGGCAILDFDGEDEESIAYLEHPLGGVMVEDGSEVRRFTDTFEDVTALALSPADSLGFIEKAATELPRSST
jgi:transcriptional regulator with XRE-family HTH domain